MQRYLETMFRHKAVFLIPIIALPLLTLLVTSYTERRFTVRATVWVEGTSILPSNELVGNASGARVINDRLSTMAFVVEVRDRSGLTDAILAGEWPQVTRLQRRLDSNSLLRRLGEILGLAPPSSVDEALDMGLAAIFRSVNARPVGKNLIVISYKGSEPALGQRLIEETLSIHQEETLATRLRESDAGVEYLTRELNTQEDRLIASGEELTRFDDELPPPPLGLARPPDELKELRRLQQAQALNETRYLSALNRLEDLRLRSDASISTTDLRFRVIDPPVAGDGSSTVPKRKMAMMGFLGLTLGIMFGTVAIVLITWRDGMVRTRADVEYAVDTPSIIDVPRLPALGKDKLRLPRYSHGVGPQGWQDSYGVVDR